MFIENLIPLIAACLMQTLGSIVILFSFLKRGRVL